MNVFYGKYDELGNLYLDEEETRHLSQVLRQKEGSIVLTNGQGRMIQGLIKSITEKRTEIEIETETIHERPIKKCLAIGFPKSRDRLEFMIEKLVELGTTEIFPIICKHSERNKVNTDRLQRIAISAMKQSKQAWLCKIHTPQPFDEVLEILEPTSNQFMAYVGAHIESDIRTKPISGASSTILIGPEGGFHRTEVNLAESRGYETISLGKRRLRTETAAIFSAAILE